jgi:hypothetical protein
MTTEISISILGALSAITVSVIGAYLANKNSIVLQTRKLKEAHYVAYIEALHNLGVDKDTKHGYVFARDKLFIIASEEVIEKMLQLEKEAFEKANERQDFYMTELIKSIRTDLKLKDKHFPQVGFKK